MENVNAFPTFSSSLLRDSEATETITTTTNIFLTQRRKKYKQQIPCVESFSTQRRARTSVNVIGCRHAFLSNFLSFCVSFFYCSVFSSSPIFISFLVFICIQSLVGYWISQLCRSLSILNFNNLRESIVVIRFNIENYDLDSALNLICRKSIGLKIETERQGTI